MELNASNRIIGGFQYVMRVPPVICPVSPVPGPGTQQCRPSPLCRLGLGGGVPAGAPWASYRDDVVVICYITYGKSMENR
jgi:hypothetical protein